MSDNGAREGLMDMGKWWFASAVFVLIVVIGLVVVLISPGDDDPDEAGPSGGETSEVATTPSETVEGEDADSGFVTLPQPTQMTDGYPTHYPQTPEGAAATAAAFQVSTGVLDYDQMYSALSAYAIGLGDVREYADGLVMVGRDSLDIPASGPPPAGVGMNAEVEAVRWQAVDSSHVTVLLSSRILCTLADGTTKTFTSAGSLPLVWADGRWWLDGGSKKPQTKETYVEPGTAQFEAAGWKVVRNTDWLGAQ